MKYIAVLFTVFNRKDKTLCCLERLYAQLPIIEGCQLDVFLTDDGCTDGTPEAVAARFPNVSIVRGTGALFGNRGMWTAWQAAANARDYDAYLWLNDDTFVYDGALNSLMHAMTETDGEAIIVGATENSRHTITYGGRLSNEKIPPMIGELVAVDYFNGNIVLVPQFVFRQLGYLDGYFTHSKGDYDYGLRAKKAGLQIYQIGKVLGECDEHPTFDKWCDPNVPFAQRWKLQNRPNGMPPRETFYFEKRHYGIIVACFHYLTVHIRCFFPKWWIRKNNPNVI